MTPIPRTYTNVSPDQWAEICATAQSAAGIPISGNVGEASKLGVDIKWNYDPATQVLILTLVHRDILDPSVARIEEKLDALVNGAA